MYSVEERYTYKKEVNRFMKRMGRIISAILAVTMLCCSCGEPKKAPKPVPVEEKEYQAKLDMLRPVLYGEIEHLTPEPGAYISVIGRNAGDSFWKEIQAGAEQAVADLNERLGYTGKDKITLRYVAPKVRDNVDEQINILDEELASSPLAVGIAAVDASACMTQFDYAKEYGIPIVMFDSGSEYQDVAATCATDNIDAARTAADKLVSAIGGAGEVALFVQDSVSMSAIDREQGFMNRIKNAYPEVTVSTVYHYDELSAMAETVAKKKELAIEEVTQDDVISYILEQHPNLKGIFTTNLDVTQHTVNLLDTLERTDLKVVGFDGGSEQMKLLEEDKVVGLIVQNPFGMGYGTVVAIIRAAYSMGNEIVIESGYEWVTKDNMNEEEIAKILY